jgi:hypothetical protein
MQKSVKVDGEEVRMCSAELIKGSYPLHEQVGHRTLMSFGMN